MNIEDARNEGLINAVKGIDVGGEGKDDKPSWLSALTGGFGGILKEIMSVPEKIIVGFGMALKGVTGGLIKLGTTLIVGLGSRLSGFSGITVDLEDYQRRWVHFLFA